MSSGFFRLSRRGPVAGPEPNLSIVVLDLVQLYRFNRWAGGTKLRRGQESDLRRAGPDRRIPAVSAPRASLSWGCGAFSCQPSDRRPQLHHVPSDPAGGPVRYRSDTKRPQPEEKTTSHTAWGAFGHNRPKRSSPQTPVRLPEIGHAAGDVGLSNLDRGLRLHRAGQLLVITGSKSPMFLDSGRPAFPCYAPLEMGVVCVRFTTCRVTLTSDRPKPVYRGRGPLECLKVVMLI